MKKEKMSNQNKTINDLQEVINALLDCENNDKNCSKCSARKKNCLIFMRDSIAVALRFIADQIIASMESADPEDIYS